MSAARAPDRYAVIGHPVGHSRSPFIHGEFARATGESLQYGLLDVVPERFDTEVRAFFAGGGRGLNVTVPHKRAAAALVAVLTPRAARAGAVNTLRPLSDARLEGDNTDGVGLVRDLETNLGVALVGRRILILGAGGAARGVLGPLLERGPARVTLTNRSRARAVELVAAFGDLGAVEVGDADGASAAPYDVVINATSASLAGTTPAIAPGAIGAVTVCYDMAYTCGDTPFTRLARQRGARAAHMGHGMLVEQAAEAFWLWRGVRPATRAVLERLRAGA